MATQAKIPKPSQNSAKWGALILCVVVAAASIALSRLPFPPFTVGERGNHPIDPLFLSILAGVLLRNVIAWSDPWRSQVSAWSKTLLPVAIALMGARLDLSELLAVSGPSLWLSALCVVLGLALTMVVGHLSGLAPRFSALLGAGTAICGGTAIAVLAPVLRADSEETALSMTTVTALGTIAIVLLPPLGHLALMSQDQFGLWAGLAVHATPQVIATGFAYGAQAGETALIVKLIRILMLIPMVVIAQLWLGRGEQSGGFPRFRKLFPPFILGFLAMIGINTLGWLDFAPLSSSEGGWTLAKLATKSSSFLFAVAMVGVGFGVDIRRTAKIGVKPFWVGTVAFLLVASLSWWAVQAWG